MPEESLQSLSKKEVIELAQPHCESSFTVPSESGKFYTAWNSMITLVNKDLVQEKGRPLRKYALTEDGWEVARRIKAAQTGDIGGNVSDGSKKRQRSKTSEMPENQGQPGRSCDRFISLENGLEADEPTRPLPTFPVSANTTKQSERNSNPAGQRLGEAPIDKYGIVSKSKSHELQVAPNRNFVELLSSPEPDSAASIPRASSTSDQHNRSASKSLQQTNIPPPSLVPQVTNDIPIPQTHSSDNSVTIPTFDSIRLAPGTFTVDLVLDNREVRTKDDRDYISEELTKKGCRPLVRPL